MKYIYILLCIPLLFTSSQAQDTLLWQNFENDILNMMSFPELDSIGTNNWVNWDEDEIPDANARPGNWDFYSDYYISSLDSIPPSDTNFVFGSSSWLEGFAPGNRNWLISPPIYIGDDQAMLHWKSAPFQGPRYMDGYSVLISTEDYYPESFEDRVFQHAQMIEPLPNGSSDNAVNALNVDSFMFAPADYMDYEGNTMTGYIHDDRYTGTYTSQDTADTFFRAILEPHSRSLAKYEGQTIYIAFLHDSDDDNLISIDDILVTGTFLSSTQEEEWNTRCVVYPNPATHLVNLSYRFDQKVEEVSIEIFDIQGKIVHRISDLSNASGEHQQSINVEHLMSGQYTIMLKVNEQQIVRKFVKK